MDFPLNDCFKLLFIAPDKFPPYRVDVRVLFGREIVSRGHTIDWLLQSEVPCDRGYETKWSGCRVFVGRRDSGTSIIRRVKNHLYSVRHDIKMFSILLKNPKYDFILVRDKFVSGLIAFFASRVFKKRFIFWLSFPIPEDYLFQVAEGTIKYPFVNLIRGYILSTLLYKILLPFSDHNFVQTEKMRDNIALKGIPREKMTAVPMAVSLKDIPFFGYNEGWRSDGKEKSVVYLGTLMRLRKIDFILRTFEKVLIKDRKVRLYLIGGSEDASDEEFLRQEAKRLRIDHAVTITGFLRQKEAWEYVKDADVCVSPIYPSPILNCGSPTKLIEYMAMGKAVVANDHPEQRLVISESKAGICVPYEEDSFAEGILYLLKNPDVAKQMGMRGREYIEKKRNYEQTADLVEKKLLQLLASTPC